MSLYDKKWNMKPDLGKALMLAQREVAVFVYDAINLEGITMTLPEVQTLLDGVTVGGHKINDQQIAVNQGKAWELIFSSIKMDAFFLSEDFTHKLHAIAANQEALLWGKFRTGGVLIAGTNYEPPNHQDLPHLFKEMHDKSQLIDDVYDKAIFIFLEMARNQFYYDVNKRMGRFMMNGVLLDEGYPAINLPAKRQLEFNELMISFYSDGDMEPMNGFMRSCLSRKSIKIMCENNS